LLAPFAKRGHFEYKKWDAHAQAVIANISGLPEKTVGATDANYWADGDLFRLVVLHNYGGVYLDCDTILLRDYGPLIGDEFAYVWGTHCVGSNGAVLRMFKGSALAKQMLATLVETPFRKRSLDWGFFLYTKVNKVMPFLRMPTCFFNANWLTPGPGWKGGPPYAPFRVAHRPSEMSMHVGPFSIHAHGAIYYECVQEGSDYVLLEKIISATLVRNYPELAAEVGPVDHWFCQEGEGVGP
jgi:hypothetical protein